MSSNYTRLSKARKSYRITYPKIDRNISAGDICHVVIKSPAVTVILYIIHEEVRMDNTKDNLRKWSGS